MGWTIESVSKGSDELKRVVSLILGGTLPGGIPIKKEDKQDADK